MRRSIATVSLSGVLREKLQAAAAARFDGVEIFENDLLHFSGSPREIRGIAADLGLAIEMYQPFRDFDAPDEARFARSLDRAERKFDLMEELGTDLILVCSNAQPDAMGDVDRLVEQFAELAERAGRRGMRVAFEALAWGTQIRLVRQAWQIVERVDHPHFGLALDSFHTLALRDDPAGIAELPGDKIFFMQLADAPALAWGPSDVLSYSRHHRCFPGQGELDVTGFVRAALAAGYTGPLSLEIFNDGFRSAPARSTAMDAMRSLLWLEEQVRLSCTNRADASHRSQQAPLFDPPSPPAWKGWAFAEFAVDPAASGRLSAWLGSLGFAHAGHHRSKDVDLWRFGNARYVLNREPDSFARSHFDQHGPSVCALALDTQDVRAALVRAEGFNFTRVPGRVGTHELTIPAVQAPDGSLLYFCDVGTDGLQGFEADFLLDAPTRDAEEPPGTRTARIDHVSQALPSGLMDSCVLFQRAVLGLVPQRNVVLHDPYGVVRSRELESADRAIRCSLMVSERDTTALSRSVAQFRGAGVQQIAIAVDDLLGLARYLRRKGAPLLPTPANYYEDLAARHALAPEFVAELEAAGVLYERDATGEFLHVYSVPFEDRFEIEFVERRGAPSLYGTSNASVHLAALAEWRALSSHSSGA
jgi:4-hydroxyphenylpyruvate dioxygenase